MTEEELLTDLYALMQRFANSAEEGADKWATCACISMLGAVISSGHQEALLMAVRPVMQEITLGVALAEQKQARRN